MNPPILYISGTHMVLKCFNDAPYEILHVLFIHKQYYSLKFNYMYICNTQFSTLKV